MNRQSHRPPTVLAFSQSDGWTLHAVAVAAGDGAAPLEAIVAAGDASNHAVFRPDELSDCLGRLLSAGLVVRSGDQYAPAPEVGARLGRGGLSRQRDTAEQLVEQAGVRSLAVSGEAPSEAASERALAAYLRLAARSAGRAV